MSLKKDTTTHAVSNSNEDDDASSQFSASGQSSSANSKGYQSADDDDTFSRRNKNAISTAKLCVLAFLLSLAVVVSYVWYQFSVEIEDKMYTDEFHEFGTKLLETFYERVEFNLLTAASLSQLLSLSVDNSDGQEQQWPFVSFANFERRTSATRRLTGSSSIWFAPIVHASDRSEWEAYAVEYQMVLNSGFNDPFLAHLPELVRSDGVEEHAIISPFRQVEDGTVERGMYGFVNGRPARVPQHSNRGSYYAPIWQSAPQTMTQTAAMFDQTSESRRQKALDTMIKLKLPGLAQTQYLGTSDSLIKDDGYMGEPHVSLYCPIWNHVAKNNGGDHDKVITAALTIEMAWKTYLSGAIEGTPGPLTVLLENTCDDSSYAFQVDAEVAEFVSEGALAFENSLELMLESDENRLDELIFGKAIRADDNSTISSDLVCKHRIKVFPTMEFEQSFLTDQPLLSSLGVGGIFILTAAVFIFYDVLVGRRQAKVEQSAKRSSAIVRSLFPAGFRDRLIDDGKKGGELLPETYLPMETPKVRLKSYLTDVPRSGNQRPDTSPSALLGTEPLADFFPNVSIVFADLSGFAAWSSTREPSQVFTLLETLYGAMDKSARKLGVFKVETVGDCYVAATGLPDPRHDHAVQIVRFANTCLVRVNALTRVLESALGPGTGELAMRFGIHSGPVTAGVLRGEKSRFQLFGDTMNTAARMSHTGEPNRVHLSKETADLLIQAGKGKWIEERKEIVTAKGKGELQTYWFLPNGMKFSNKENPDNLPSAEDSVEQSESQESKESQSAFSTTAQVKADGDHSKESEASHKSLRRSTTTIWGNGKSDVGRLVDWNVELLCNLLKKIVARRSIVDTQAVDRESSQHGNIPLDEVKEVVKLPEFNADAAVKMAADLTVELPESVRPELRDYVHRIADLYDRSNSFHNFEHASHVALSSNKLLRRIVMPECVDYRRNSRENEIEKVKAVARDLHKVTYGIASDPVTQFAVVFSALIHDVGHTGVPNPQLAKEEPGTASKYRSKSIAEQRSIDLAWELLMTDGYVNLRHCMFPTEIELKHFRQLIVNMVVATDIFDTELAALRKARWQRAFHPDDSIKFLEESDDNRKATIVIEHIIQASDVSHTMQHWLVYLKWNERFFMECYGAYKAGRAAADPSTNWYKGEIAFFDHYIIPLAKKLKECGVFGVASDEYLNYAVANREEWVREGEQIVEGYMSMYQGM